MVTLYPRITTYNHCIIRPQEPDLLSRAKRLNRRQAQWPLYLSEFDV